MIDDPQHPLVQMLEGTTAERVYLPQEAQVRAYGKNEQAKTETQMINPRVAAAAREYFESPDALHGDEVPDTTITREKPIHRMMIYLHAQGASLKEIAERTGYSYQTVMQLMKQPWARQRLIQILNECGKDEVKHFLTHEVSPSLNVLREIRDTGNRAADRLNAANAILDRALGKPVSHIETDNTTRNVPADMQRIEQEIAAVRKELSQKGFSDANN